MITQKELATLTGCTKGHLNRIFNGKSNASKKLAKVIAQKTDTDPALWIFGATKARQKVWERFQYVGGAK